MTKTVLEPRVSQSQGVVSRVKNTERVFVPPNQLGYIAGTWSLTNDDGVFSMNKTTADTTSTIYIPYSGPFSDANIQGTATDRGVQVLGVELLCVASTANLEAAITLEIRRQAIPANGAAVGAAAVVPSTLGGNVAAAASDNLRRVTASIAPNVRFFVDSANGAHGVGVIDAAAASVVKVYGAIWHIRRLEE